MCFVKVSQQRAWDMTKLLSAKEIGMLRRIQIFLLSAALLPAVPLAAQNTVGVRRPGGGAGMDYKDYDAATLERGRTAFVANCGGCHGSNAKGGENGPDLIRSV